MKISYKWLSELIDLRELKPEEVSSLLTNCGLEVENLEQYQSIPGGLQGIVVGKVLEKEKHPNADKLSVCKVDIGTDVVKQIVCGAPNVAAGQTVLVATVGATVYPGKGEPFKINKSKIRGEVSEGMICAEDELSLGLSHDGIMVLPDSYAVGKPASDYFEVYEDWIFEIGLTANRGDAASHLGVARDLRALLNRNLYPTGYKLSFPAEKPLPQVIIEDTEGCKRYTGILLSGITVAESPQWMKDKLRSIGLNPINNIVDATNYVLHETGQPLHAFDWERVDGRKIVVKKAVARTRFTTLDKVERTLKGHECMITDGEKALAIAGVFGGLDSGISENTRQVFLESAYFSPQSVRKTAKAHGLSTDASFRFERGTDPNGTVAALNQLARLILDTAGGELASQLVDVYLEKVPHTTIDFSIATSNALIGKNIDKDEIVRILTALEIEIAADEGDLLRLSVPPYRSDVTRAADITEEILRIHGLNNIEIGTSIKSTIALSEAENVAHLKNKLAGFLSANGFNEIMNNSLTRSAYYTEEENKNAVALLNPLSNELDILRPDMLFGMLEAIQYNANRKMPDVKFYEFGKVYKRTHEAANSVAGYQEQMQLVLAMSGAYQQENWTAANRKTNYFDLKKAVESLLKLSGLNKYNVSENEAPRMQQLSQISFSGSTIVSFGCVSADVAKQFDMDNEVWYACIDFDRMVSLSQQQKFRLKPVSVFPAVRRDLALLLDAAVTYGTLENIARKTEPSLLREINAFDVYTGDKIEKGKKSYALSFVLQDDHKTLTDAEIEGVMKKLVVAFEKEAGAVLRS